MTNLDHTMTLDDHIQRQVDLGISGTDILHGYLKVLLVEAERELEEAQQIEEDNDYSDAMESMERKYWEGQCDALTHVYSMTYALAFAIQDRIKKNG
jgi:hypothetical protein